MAKSFEDILKKVSPARREKIEARAKDLVAEHMTLQDVRKALNFTQKDLSKHLKIGQDSVSRMEKRTDLLISTLRNYIKAMGGELQLIAHFPDRPPVELAGIAELDCLETELENKEASYK